MTIKQRGRILLVMIAIIALVAGCGDKVTDINKSPDNTKPNPQTQVKEPELVKATGIYTGRIDNNSVEIQITEDGKPVVYGAFKLSEELKAKFDQEGFIQDGDKVEFEYIPGISGERQPDLISITPIKP